METLLSKYFCEDLVDVIINIVDPVFFVHKDLNFRTLIINDKVEIYQDCFGSMTFTYLSKTTSPSGITMIEAALKLNSYIEEIRYGDTYDNTYYYKTLRQITFASNKYRLQVSTLNVNEDLKYKIYKNTHIS